MADGDEQERCEVLVQEAAQEVCDKRRELAKAYVQHRVAEMKRAQNVARQLENEVENLKEMSVEEAAQEAEEACFYYGD